MRSRINAIKKCASACSTSAITDPARCMAQGSAMIKTQTRKLFNVVFFVACTLAFIVSGCSPFDGLQVPTSTATTEPTPTILSIKPSVTPSPTPQTCTVTAYTLNMRTGPSMTSAVKQILTRGERVTVIRRGDWLKVSTRTATGFIYSRYCEQE